MRISHFLAASAAALTLAACSAGKTEADLKKPAAESPMKTNDNLLLAEWTGPYGGVPAFDKVSLDDLKPALEKGMEINLAEIDAITSKRSVPTFKNTIVPLERSGAELNRIFTYWGIWSSNKSSPEFRAIQGEMAPKLSAFNSKITQNQALFNRIKAVYEGQEMETLRPDQQRVVQLTYDGFARNGALLDEAGKKRFEPVVYHLKEWVQGNHKVERKVGDDKGGTMRLGAYDATLTAGSRVAEAYGTTAIDERHRHRYEVDIAYKDQLEKAGLTFSGMSPDGKLPEIVEWSDHPWFIGVQFHPELKSKPFEPHPLFRDFVRAAKETSRLV